MAAIKEILEFEASREGEEMQRSIHLFQEDSFYRAYEWSAWLMCCYIHEFKVTHRRMKGVEQTVSLIGFPVTSLNKWLSDNFERHEVGDKHIMYRLAADALSDISEGETAGNAFESWKARQPIVENPSKAVAANAATAFVPVSLTAVAQRIMSFPIEAKSPIECYQFLSEIKQQLAMLY